MDTQRNLICAKARESLAFQVTVNENFGLEGDGFKHGTVKHGAGEFAYYDYRHDATHHTKSVESFWRLFKNSISSTHIHVSSKYMDRYLNEFVFRSDHREMGNAMFDLLIAHL